MARQTKKARLAAIRAKLQSMDLKTKTVDLAVAVMLAANEVARESGVGFAPSDTTRVIHSKVQGDIIVPDWASGSDNEVGKGGTKVANMAAPRGPRAYSVPRVSGESELREAIDLLAERSPRLVAPLVVGNRVSKQVALGSRVVRVNGLDSTPEEAEVQYRNQSYSVPTHATSPERKHKEPLWSRSELDNALMLESYRTFRALESRRQTQAIRSLPALWLMGRPDILTLAGEIVQGDGGKQSGHFPYTSPRLVLSHHVPAAFDVPEENERTVRMIARSRRDAMANQIELDALQAAQRAEKAAIEADSKVTAPRVWIAYNYGLSTHRFTVQPSSDRATFAPGWNDTPEGYETYASHIRALSRIPSERKSQDVLNTNRYGWKLAPRTAPWFQSFPVPMLTAKGATA